MKKNLVLTAALLFGAMSVWAHDGDHSYNTNGVCTIEGCEDPYQPATQAGDGYWELANAGNVEWFSGKVKAEVTVYTNARLTADIDLDGITHRPIGEESANKYRGIFDGQGHRILNMTAFTQNDRVGFFGATRCESAYIKNLIIDSSCHITGNTYVGAFVGSIMYPSDPNYTTLENCINEADVEATGSEAGGLIGGAQFNDGTAKIVNCINRGDVTAAGTAGAFIGKSTGTAVIIASYNEGKVLAGQVGTNNLIADGAASFNGVCDISGMENASQGNVLPASAKASGELCYLLNGDQSTITWTQTIGTDAAPVLGTASSQVYAHGQILCNGTSAPGTLYDNNGPDGVVNLDHDYGTTGICSVCSDFQPAEQVDGWYELRNAGNIEWMSKVIQQNAKGADNVAYATSKFKMMNDIDFTGVTHTKIGQNETYKFDGTFDGQGHRITNLVMNEPSGNHIGFFGYCRGGSTLIQNLIIDKTCSFYGDEAVAALVGTFQRAANAVTIQNVVNEANVTAKSKSAAAFVGGKPSNTDMPRLYIKNCINTGDIKVEANVTGNDCAAAIIANYNNGGGNGGNSTLTNCVNVGKASPLNGQNTLFTGSFRSYENCYDVTEGKMNNQNIAIAAWNTLDPVKSGELCYRVNGDQTAIVYYQTIGTDDYPVPFNTSGQVYESATYNCDQTPLGGVEYTNVSSGEPVYPDHVYDAEIGMCKNCYKALFDEPALVDDYYELKNPGNVEWYSQYVAAAGGNHKSAKLMNDIDFKNVENMHSPIGPNGQNKFNATFDGQGYRIKNMIIERPGDDNIGFFGWLRGNNAPTTVKNLIIDASCTIHAHNRVGGITGTYQNGGSVITIENVVNEATIIAEHQDAAGIIGGHDAGGPTIIIRNVLNTGTITAKNENPFAGALCCYMETGGGSLIENFVNLGTVNGHLGGNIGRYNISDVKNLIDLSDTEDKTQGVVDGLTTEAIANGRLAYIVGWWQELGMDAYPMPFAKVGGVVYRTGEVRCDGADIATTTYSNTDDGVVTGSHDYNTTTGFCDLCAQPNPDFKTLVDGAYELGNAIDVVWFSAMVNTGNPAINGKLTADIDFESVENALAPIGTMDNKYVGTFDGQGNHIQNLVITSANENIGFFGAVAGGANIQNMVLESTCSITGSARLGLIGSTNGAGTIYLTNLGNEGTVTGTKAQSTNAAGIIGGNPGGSTSIQIDGCYSTGKISGPSENAQIAAWTGESSFIKNTWSISEVENPQSGREFSRYKGDNHDGQYQNCFTTYHETNGGLSYDTPLEKFASGEVAYTINQNAGKEVFTQLLGTDEYPVFGSETVSFIGEAGYATLYDTTTGYVLNGDVEAYVAVLNKTWLDLTKIENVPVSTPVILKGTYFNKIAADLAAINIANDLKGTDADTAADGTMYILAKVDDKVGFYKAEGTIPAGKAYYQSTSGVKAFFFDGDEATGIEMVNGQSSMVNGQSIYNVAGQKLTKMQRGINIVNGKKILK